MTKYISVRQAMAITGLTQLGVIKRIHSGLIVAEKVGLGITCPWKIDFAKSKSGLVKELKRGRKKFTC